MVRRFLSSLILLALSLLAGCKTPNTASRVKSIGSEEANQIVVFQADTSNAFRQTCADAIKAMNAVQCPGTKKTIVEFRANLANQGINGGDIDAIVKLLGDWRTHDAGDNKVKTLVGIDDLNLAFGIKPQGSGQAVVGGVSATVVVPPPSTTDTPLAKKEVLAAMNQVRGKFNMDLNSYVIPCLANETPHWSDIVIHYYCQHGQPRACFTPKARANTKDLAGYEKAYEDCKTETQNHVSNNFDWVVNNQENVFRYIMYSVYTPGRVQTFKQEDQDEVINAFYGVSDPEDTTECGKRPRRKNETRPAGQHCGKRVVTNIPPQQPQPTPQPIPQPTPQPIPQPTPQPIPQPTPQPIPQPNPTSGNSCNKYSGIDSSTNRLACKGDAAGCNWDYASKICFGTKGPDCEYYTNLGFDSSDVRLACKAHVMGCDWSYSTKKCFRTKVVGNCSYYNQFGGSSDSNVRLTCKSNNCTWDYAANSCR